jgi:hypothetical protein
MHGQHWEVPVMLAWLRRSMGESRGGIGAALGALDQVFNPGAARAKELTGEQHERVIPTPSPGDRMLDEGRIVIEANNPEP